jgi:hypothetical protein
MRPDMFFDTVPLARMPAIYSSCDVLVKLSSVEGFFGPPLEMMSCGGTAITSDVTGHDEFMRHGENGIVVPGGNPCLVREWLVRLMQDRAMLAMLRRNALTTAAEFRWDATLAKVHTWMQELSTPALHGGPSSLFQSRSHYAMLEICARHYRSRFPTTDGIEVVHQLNLRSTPGEHVYLKIVGWSWPSPATAAYYEGGRILDSSFTFAVRPDVIASGCCPPGGLAGFTAEVLLEIDGHEDGFDPCRLAVKLKDGTSISPTQAYDGQGHIDFVDRWAGVRISFRCQEVLDPSFTFRMALEGRCTEILLFDNTSPLALASATALAAAPENKAAKTHRIVDTDHMLLYYLAENPDATCFVFVPEHSRLTNAFAVRKAA